MSNSMASVITGIGPTWFHRRQLGVQNPLGTRDYIYKQVYSRTCACEVYDHGMNNGNIHGAVFSLEFSPEGSLLVAACEKRSILLFDPLTYKEVHTVENAHRDCVNGVKFLDSRSFATCSDDFTVALWDARNLSQKVRTFKGHTNWVKNIEYCSRDGLLVTSGFDGNILTWEMNKYREEGMVYNKVFATNGLMRTCLTPDASKMLISTTGGYLIIIHNLDLNTLNQDLDGFKPNMYRLMQLSQTILPIASDFTPLFLGPGKRNRVEFITDFPKGDDAEVVSALQVHPDGHCAISRNVSNGEQSEWSCVHNIEERTTPDESDTVDVEDIDLDGYKTINWSASSTSISTTPSYIIQHANVQNDHNRQQSDGGSGTEQRDLSVSPADVWEALVAIQEARVRREQDRMALYRGQVTSGNILVRPLHSGSDSRIFVTRLVSNSNSNSNSTEEQERAPQRTENVNPPSIPRRNISINTSLPLRNVTITTSVARRNVSLGASIPRRSISINTDLVGLPNDRSESSEPDSNSPIIMRSILRRRIPPLHRYCSLYRRSLVGQYDRTSIRRKPIYRPRANGNKFRRLNHSAKLNTNYEMNETQRLQIELNKGNCTAMNLRKVAENVKRNKRASGSGVAAAGNKPAGSPIIVKSSAQSECGESSTSQKPCSVIFAEYLKEKKKMNSLRKVVNRIHGAGNSTLYVPNCENQQSASNSSHNLISLDNGNTSTINNNNNNNNNNNHRHHNSENTDICEVANNNLPVNNNDDNEAVDREQIISREVNSTPFNRLNEEETVQNSLTSQPTPFRNSTPPPTTQGQSDRLRTILMGVFRAGNEEGMRGTSMRRHNIAAVTVSSSSQRTLDSTNEDLNVTRSRCRNSSGNHLSNSPYYGGYNTNTLKHYTSMPVNRKIHQNIRRLTHYTEEPNLGKGFIKELCISSDGRVICSPFGNGIRLLSFSPAVQDLSHCYPYSGPIPLHELWLKMAHSDTVVSTKFSPFHNLLVSGCLSGKIVYYQPQL